MGISSRSWSSTEIAAVPTGTDPKDDCAAFPPSTCGTTGLCGARGCLLYAAGTVCTAASCVSNGLSQPADLCNGGGACVDSGLVPCTPYTCDPATGSCRTSCTTSAECLSGFDCVAGTCLKSAGQSCAIPGECASGACGVPCDLANASESCSTGTCTLTSCNFGYSNCDGNQGNGCELSHATPSNSCGAAEYVGARCGDTNCGFLCPGSSWSQFVGRTGRASRWFRARASECSGCCANIHARITLTPPAGTDYDLYVYSSCGVLWAASTNGTGAVDQVTITSADDCLAGDSGFDYWVEVRWYSGASCSSWLVTFDGTDC